MTPNKIFFTLRERPNKNRPRGKEWALDVRFEGYSPWTILSWGNKPTRKTVEAAKEMIVRSFEIYHAHLRISDFKISVGEE